MLYIHPEEFIDCGAGVPGGPGEADFHEDNLAQEGKGDLAMNAEMSEKCEVITEKKTPLAEN